MKRMKLAIVLLIALSIATLGGWDIVTAKRLIVSNTSSSVTITGVQVNQYVGSRMRLFEDMMGTGETISPGESKTFYIAPSTSARGTSFTVEYASSSLKSVGFTYDYQVNHINGPVNVAFDGTDFTVSGSNAVILQDSWSCKALHGEATATYEGAYECGNPFDFGFSHECLENPLVSIKDYRGFFYAWAMECNYV